MPDLLIDKRCRNHQNREAAARCPDCSRYFCRECVTQQKGRVLCAACLQSGAGGKANRRVPLKALSNSLRFLMGVFLIWSFYYYTGLGLRLIPSSFHEGTIWNMNTWELE